MSSPNSGGNYVQARQKDAWPHRHHRIVQDCHAQLSNPDVPIHRRTEASRPVKAGTGKHRGDRRDMNKAYTGNAKHAARGNTPRVNVATRKD